MSKLIEVEIENKSYIKLLNLEQKNTKILKLTTLIDNQAAVVIKIFLNKAGTRIPIKEFNIRNLKPKVSGLPRFELLSSYNNKILNLKLKVDGRKIEDTNIKLAAYLRNKLLPLYILLFLVIMFLLFSAGKWIYNSSTVNTNTQINVNKTITEETVLVPEITKTNPEPAKKTLKISEPVTEPIVQIFIAYFEPNNTRIQEKAAQKLKNIARDLLNTPGAKVEISGYCALTGTEEGREKLSRERAYNVLSYLKSEGWIPETEPVVKWYGGEMPATLNKDEIYKNRRVEISIVLPR